MQPNVPFRLVEVLASSRVGSVWAGVDPAGRPVTVAILDETAAADLRWRAAFESAARTMTQPNGAPLPVVNADFTAATPWVAVLADGGPGALRVFQSLGVEWLGYWPGGPTPPAPTPAQPAPTNTTAPAYGPIPPVLPDPATASRTSPWSTPPVQQPVSPPPVSWPPVSSPPVSSPPISSPPDFWPPASSPPVAFASDRPISAQPAAPWAASQPPSRDPILFPVPDVPPAPRRRWRGMWVTLAVVVVLALAGGATVVVMTVFKDGERPLATPSSAASSIPLLPTPSPRQPGLEPPRPGDWPRWPAFAATDKVRQQALDGTGLTLTLPTSWNCTRAASAEGATRYNCGTAASNGDEVGGEITVRTCAAPCDAERRDAMRQAEEAWGQQWRFAGDPTVIAETKTLNGSTRYGLVVVAYWHSKPDGAVDRQLVLRMTAPTVWINDIRRVANAARDAARF